MWVYGERRTVTEFDMDGCVCLGVIDDEVRHVISICWGCQKPIGTCAWLMLGRPYLGSEYYMIILSGDVKGYIMARCPKWEGDK